MPPPRSPSPGVVITLDEIQRKAVEITERKNSMSSSMSAALMEDEDGDCEIHDDDCDDDERDGTPVQHIGVVEDDDVGMSAEEQG